MCFRRLRKSFIKKFISHYKSNLCSCNKEFNQKFNTKLQCLSVFSFIYLQLHLFGYFVITSKTLQQRFQPLENVFNQHVRMRSAFPDCTFSNLFVVENCSRLYHELEDLKKVYPLSKSKNKRNIFQPKDVVFDEFLPNEPTDTAHHYVVDLNLQKAIDAQKEVTKQCFEGFSATLHAVVNESKSKFIFRCILIFLPFLRFVPTMLSATVPMESKTWLCIYFSFIFFFVGVTVNVSVERLRWLECFDQKCKYYFSK